MLRESNSVRGDDVLTLAKDLRRVCFECIGFVFGCNAAIFEFLFEHCSSLLSELLPQIAGTFWLDDAAPDWRLKTEVTDEIIQSHLDNIMYKTQKLTEFENLVNMSTKVMNSFEGKYKHLKGLTIYEKLTKLHGFHVVIHEKMTGILKNMKPRVKNVVNHLQGRQETGRAVPRNKMNEMLLHRIMNI